LGIVNATGAHVRQRKKSLSPQRTRQDSDGAHDISKGTPDKSDQFVRMLFHSGNYETDFKAGLAIFTAF